MYEIIFAPQGKKDLQKFTKDFQLRILKKLQYFASSKSPIFFSKPLINFPPSTHRFRVGNFRIAFHIVKTTIFIDKIVDRKEVYK